MLIYETTLKLIKTILNFNKKIKLYTACITIGQRACTCVCYILKYIAVESLDVEIPLHSSTLPHAPEHNRIFIWLKSMH